MQIIRPKAFWIYTAVGLVVASLAGTLYCAFNWARDNPYYSAYEKMSNGYSAEIKKVEFAKSVREKTGATRPFQEVLLGDKPADALTDPKVRDLALALRPVEASDRMIMSKRTADLPRLMNADCLHITGYQEKGSYEFHISSFWYACKTAEYELVHTEPYRIASLLQGDRTALTALPDVPELSAEATTFAKLPVVPKTLPITWALGNYIWLWLAFSGAFAAAYTVTGLVGGDVEDERPLRTVPGFVLGWLIMLATLPGFLLVYAVWLTWLILTGDVASAIKKLNAKRADALKLKLGNKLLATLRAHTEVNGYRDPAVRVVLEPDNLRRALASNVLPESSKEEVEQYLSLSDEYGENQTPRQPVGTPFGGGGL